MISVEEAADLKKASRRIKRSAWKPMELHIVTKAVPLRVSALTFPGLPSSMLGSIDLRTFVMTVSSSSRELLERGGASFKSSPSVSGLDSGLLHPPLSPCSMQVNYRTTHNTE